MSETPSQAKPVADLPVALTIATSDSGAGAGVQADLLTFAAHEVHGVTAFAALTAQNPDGVTAIAELEPDFLCAQLDQLFAYFDIGAAKTGMLFSAPLIETVASFLDEHPISLVVDPVMVATSGAVLLKEDAVETLKTRLLPKAALITPNLDEAAVLIGEKPTSREAMKATANELAQQYQTNILLKGGHLEDEAIVDVLVTEQGLQAFAHSRIGGVDTHGSGCTLSAAIAANVAKGQPLSTAVKNALDYLERSLRSAKPLVGRRFINHNA